MIIPQIGEKINILVRIKTCVETRHALSDFFEMPCLIPFEMPCLIPFEMPCLIPFNMLIG